VYFLFSLISNTIGAILFLVGYISGIDYLMIIAGILLIAGGELLIFINPITLIIALALSYFLTPWYTGFLWVMTLVWLLGGLLGNFVNLYNRAYCEYGKLTQRNQ